MHHYNHLTLLEREKILYFLAKGYKLVQIAKELGRDKSTISREIRRNSHNEEYMPVTAQDQYLCRRSKCRRHKKLDDISLMNLIKECILQKQWSPEQISERIALEHHKRIISYPTIYRAIYAGDLEDYPLSRGCRGVIRKLRHRGKKRHKKGCIEHRGKIKISHSLSERPCGATNRSRRGHWEADTVIGTPGKACLVTLVDRKSRFLLSGKAMQKKADFVNQVIIHQLQGHPVRSITPDRGKEFAKHAKVTAALDQVQFYFPEPHHPWERGTNENTNSLIREYFPKGVDITEVSDEYIQSVVDKMNLRPRKCLGYKTPYEVYYSKTLHLT